MEEVRGSNPLISTKDWRLYAIRGGGCVQTVLAIVVPSLSAKEGILAGGQTKFFTEPHYNGYPAVLVRIAEIGEDEMEDLLIEAWRTKAGPDLQTKFEGG